MVRNGARCDRVEDVPPAPSNTAAEPVVDVSRERVRADLVQQPVADPVRVDNSGVERVVDPVRRSDQFEIRPGAFEGACELRETAVGGVRIAILE
jgi:hypothetical protein